MLAIRGDLFQACCLRPRMMNEALKLALDFLKGVEVLARGVGWLRIAHRRA